MVIAGLTVAVGLHLKLTYDKAVRDAETLAAALAVAAEQHIGGSLAGIDTLLDELAATVREGRQSDPHFSREFQARLASFPELRFIGLIDADGELQRESWPPYRMPVDGINLAHREYFSAQRAAKGQATMLVGEPTYSFSTNERVMHLSRPVRDRDGRFAGVVFAAVDPNAYGAFLSSIAYDPKAGAGLISTRGRIAALAPDPDDKYGHDISGGALFRDWLPRAPAGVAHLPADAEGRTRLVAYRAMPELSLMVTIGITLDRALAQWKPTAAAETGLLAVFCGLLLYWAERIRRREDVLASRQRFMEHAVEQRSRALEDARALAEQRAGRLSWINDELKRLTLVTSHHLHEPLRAIVSCGQMVARTLPEPPPGLTEAVEALGNKGVGLKERLSQFEKHVAALTATMQERERAAALAAPASDETADTDSADYRPKPVFSARAVAAVIILVLLSGNAWQIRADYHSSLEAAERLTDAVVNSLERHLETAFRRIDTLVRDVALAVEDGRHTSPEFRERVLSRMDTMVEIRQLAYFDTHGQPTPWTWSTDGGTARPQPINGRDVFTQQATAAQRDRIVIGEPRRDGGAERLIRLSRPVMRPGGPFEGIVHATVEADYFARLLETLLQDPEGGSAVITLKGGIAARAPAQAEKFGLDISNSDLFTRYLPQAPDGIAHLISKADGNHKLLGYRVIDGFPLVVTSGYSYRRALAQWKLGAIASTLLALVSSAVLFGWAWHADRHARDQARYRRNLAEEVAARTAGLAAAHRAADQRSTRLAQANGQMRELIQLIAADMQGPLQSLSERIAEVQRLAGGRHEECDHWLSFITAGGVHLKALLRDCQRFVAALSDMPRLRPLETGEIAQGAAKLVSGMWGERVRFDIGPLPTISADRDMILELFLQLFANAAVHAAQQRPVTVRVGAEAQPGRWRFTVSDDGPGLPQVNIDQLFRAFETAHGRDPDSTGLGLPLCRIIVQAHGGRIWATSRPGKGCDIHFVLPETPTDRFPLAGNPAQA